MFDMPHEPLLPDSPPLMQDPAFAAALRACGQTPVMLPGGLMLLYRRICGVPIAMLPRAAPPPDLQAQMAKVGLPRTPMILSPERPVPVRGALRLAAAKKNAVLDLSQPVANRWAAQHPKWRNQLRRAERAGLRVTQTILPADPSHPLLVAEAAQAAGRAYRNWPPTLTAAFAAAAPNQTRLFTALYQRQPIAHMLFLRHGRAATYHIGQISDAGKKLCAHNLLLWRGAEWLASQGHDSLDLGLLDERTPSLTRFKMRSGARSIATGGTWLRWQPLARRRRPC